MEKNKTLSTPLIGMNRNKGGYSLSEKEYFLQLNGRVSEEDKYSLTTEHSNILATRFKEGFRYIGGKNHVVRNKTYIFLTNPQTKVSEIGCIINSKEFAYEKDIEQENDCEDCTKYTNKEVATLEKTEQLPHQEYITLVEDSCNLCLGFNIDNPIVDILIKEENIGTKLFWTSTPGNKEFRYLELDNLEQYKVTGDDNCGAVPEDTCLDCDKLRVFKLYTEIKSKNYERTLGGNLNKGSYEVLAAYSDILGNEFTTYTTLTPIIPIVDEANIIHEQVDNNAETNFAIKIELDQLDSRFDHYKVAVVYYTSKGVFSTFVSGIYNTSDKVIIIPNNNGESIPNTTLRLKKPFVETIDGATASNDILILNGIKEREPINLQPVVNLMGLGLQWMSFRAKEGLYSNATSYKFTGYNRDENQQFAIDFGFTDGHRTDNFIFIPKPLTDEEVLEFEDNNGQSWLERQVDNRDTLSVTSVVGECDGNIRNKKWQFYNTATEIGSCPNNEEIETVAQTENVTTYTLLEEDIITSGTLIVGRDYLIRSLKLGDDFSNVGYQQDNLLFTATATTPLEWSRDTEVVDITNSIPPVPKGAIFLEEDIEDFTTLADYIEENQNSCTQSPYSNSPLQEICSFIDKNNLTSYNKLPEQTAGVDCTEPLLEEEALEVDTVYNESIINTNKKLEDYSTTRPPEFCDIISEDIDEEFSSQYALDYLDPTSGGINLENTLKKRNNTTYADSCQNSIELSIDALVSNALSFVHPYHGAEQTLDTTNNETLYENILENKNAIYTKNYTVNEIGGIGADFTQKIHKGALWFKINIKDKDSAIVELTRLLDRGGEYWRLGDSSSTNLRKFKNRNVRVHFFANCNEIDPITTTSYTDENGETIIPLGGIYDLSKTHFIPLSKEVLTTTGIFNDFIYMVVDLPLSKSVGIGEGNFVDDQPQPTIIDTVVTVPLNSCFSISVRDVEVSKREISFDSISLRKRQKYNFSCEYQVPLLNDCEPVPYKYGEMGYYESIDKYPDNIELYDSSKLLINKNVITNTNLREKLKLYTQNETSNTIELSEKADFRCANIRAYKFPDNKISPFIRTEQIASNSESVISPLGITIDGEVINNLLDVAVDNGLITKEKRESIIDYKIYRADSTLSKSIVGSGLVFNTKSYVKNNEKISYFNYPFNSLGKDKYFSENKDEDFNNIQVVSPEFDYFKPSLPDEMTLQGFIFGKSNSRILPVDEHSKMVILGRKARNLANTLAILEVVAEGIINVAQSAEAYRVQFGFANSFNPVGIGLNIAVAAISVASSVVFKVGRYRLEWLRAFENLGAPYNFGHYLAAGSNYNYMKPLQIEGDKLRGLTTKKYLKGGLLSVSDTVSGNSIKINNIDREETPFFSMGDFPIENLDAVYTNYDNVDVNPNFSSQIISSEIGCEEGKSTEQVRNIASPYVAFKNYIPNQYGTVNSIKWIDTTYCIPISDKGACNGVLGGDTFITRHSKKRKVRMFETDLLGSADLTPFPYRFYGNYGQPNYYIDYKVNSEFTSSGRLFPDIFYDVQFDCNVNTNKFYVEPPGKFYLYSISYTNFLCESKINTEFRNARKEPWNQFYPQNTDYESISQPNVVALTRPESFFYNKAYLQTNIGTTNFILPEYYSSENEKRKSYNTNSVMYSLPDVNENSITEPWLMYRPNDRATLESSNGKLTNIKGIESGQLLMYFEDAIQLQNAVNQFTDGSTQYNSDLGNGGMFGKRPRTLKTTDLGYGGSQSKQTLSCEFGHFHADLKRGQVFNYMGGMKMDEISRHTNGTPNGMDIWFKEHLPLKILRSFPDLEKIDNPYNGIGIHWGYDSKYRRVLLTKKDYIPITKQGITSCEGKIVDDNIDNYIEVVNDYQANGYVFDGIEGCDLKFTKQTINSNTDIYAIFDTTSMQLADGQAASLALNTWFTNFKISNPSFTGSLYIIPFQNEAYVSFPTLIQSGAMTSTTFGNWSSIAVLPPDLNTPDWEPPTDLLLLAFIDESNSQYHGSTVEGGFSSSGIIQPTPTYFNNYKAMALSVNNYNSFKGVVYPIVQNLSGNGGALVLQALAAIEGKVLTQEDISKTNTSVDVSILLTENPYENTVIPGTDPQQFLQPLSDFNWIGQYDKVSPASSVFSSEQFQEDLNNLVSGGQTTEIVYEPLREVLITDKKYFKEVSWTISYKPETGAWESYMSYTPNYYINHTDYFQSGNNSDDSTHGLWSHLLTNKSYRVFYGHKFPYIIEYPIKNEYISKTLEDVKWNAQLKRYHNDYDYAMIESNPFTALTVYNNYENSGKLLPVLNNGAISQLSKYPITRSDNTQEILISYDNYKYNTSYFYNRVNSNRNNQPIWLWDENQIDKKINNKGVSFYGKPTLERLKGDYFIVRLERDDNTNLDLDFRWSEQTTNFNR